MPGKRITDHQVNRYKELRRQFRQEAAAAKVGVSVRSARRIEQTTTLPSQRRLRSSRTRIDPLAGVWETELVPLLRQTPALTAVTLLEELARRYPGRFEGRVLRTLQRRVRRWRALEGEEREVFFAQEHTPGRQGLSDFTDAAELGVRVAGSVAHIRERDIALARSPCEKARAAAYSNHRIRLGSVRSIPSRAPLPVFSHRQFEAARTVARGNARPGGINVYWHREILQHR